MFICIFIQHSKLLNSRDHEHVPVRKLIIWDTSSYRYSICTPSYHLLTLYIVYLCRFRGYQLAKVYGGAPYEQKQLHMYYRHLVKITQQLPLGRGIIASCSQH